VLLGACGGDVVRVEPAGRIWLTIQDQMRVVLNGDWDPIGLADIVDDEYDTYVLLPANLDSQGLRV
jgi:hypothetical protein